MDRWPSGLHHLFRMLYEGRSGIQSNPHKDMFGKNYHAWLKLIGDPHFSFVRKEYESFIRSYWTEPIRPQSHLARSGCTKQSLITATQAAKLFGVSAKLIRDALSRGKIEAPSCPDHPGKKALWMERSSVEAWARKYHHDQAMLCPTKHVQFQLGFSAQTLVEFRRSGLFKLRRHRFVY